MDIDGYNKHKLNVFVLMKMIGNMTFCAAP